MAGKLEVSFVEKVRFEAAARQVCRSIVGRTIEAISNCYNPAFRNSMIVMFLRLNVVHDSLPRITSRELPRLHKVISDSGDWLDDGASKSAVNDFDPGIPRL
jgi:hypothetical protein